MHKILIVEDDPVIANAIAACLSSWGEQPQAIEDFSRVIEEFAAFLPSLVLMDIGLPFYNGYHWCSEIRKISKVPIIFLSSASDKMNLVMAVNMGADDFLAKPFDSEVLVAKVKAMLRRTYDFAGETNLMEHRGLILNLNDASAAYEGKRAELTKNEYRILKILMENRGKTVSREAIMAKLWESDSFIDDNTLTVNITRLRKKLEQLGLTGLIETKKGMGYTIGKESQNHSKAPTVS